MLGLVIGWVGLAQAEAASLLTFLKFVSTTPEIKGTSVVSGYEDQIELVNYSFAGETPFDLYAGGGGAGSGKFTFSGVNCLMQIDGRSYPSLMMALATSANLGEVVITVLQTNVAGGGKPVEILKLEMKDVHLTSVDLQGANSDAPVVSALLMPARMQITTVYPKADGTYSDAVVFKWDFTKATASY